MITRARKRAEKEETVGRVLEHRGVVQRVQSFLPFDFLFVGGVCKSWRREMLPASKAASASGAVAGSKPAPHAVAAEPANAALRLSSLKSATASLSRFAWSLDSGLTWSEETLRAVLRHPSASAIQLLEIVREVGYLEPDTDELFEACETTAELGNTDVLEWLCAGSVDVAGEYDVCVSAARGGYLETLEWLYDRGFPFHEGVCDEAARNGHLAVLEWAYKNDCLWSAAPCVLASDNGHDEVVEFLHDNDCPCECPKPGEELVPCLSCWQPLGCCRCDPHAAEYCSDDEEEEVEGDY